MQTTIASQFREHPQAETAQSILRACVHCGFCNATCPTYLELGDERDGPRGRIYLIKEMLEGAAATTVTQQHLDRCLTCLNCETTCPSGVRYGRLLDIGRDILEHRVPRGWRSRLLRALLKRTVPYVRRFSVLLAIARALLPVLPRSIQEKVPQRKALQPLPASSMDHRRQMVLLSGCVQAAATPRTNRAATRVFDRVGIALVEAARGGCCGALSYHIGDHRDGRRFARRNIDAWWPHIVDGAEAIVVTASGCGAFVKEYGRVLADDPAYGSRAEKVSELTKDVAEILSGEDLSCFMAPPNSPRIAVHCPCTLQHAQKRPDLLETILDGRGFTLAKTKDPHLCCGSAGAYSILQPKLSRSLRDKKLAALSGDDPDAIVTANVGCQLHLDGGSDIPVMHWIEVLDATRAD